jgi:hypothetical protein
VEIDLLNHVRNIRTSECQVLQSTDQATIMSGVLIGLPVLLEIFDYMLTGVAQGLESTMPAHSLISIMYYP